MFRSLTNLIVVWLRGNKCIDEDFIADDNLGDLVKIVSTNCGLSSQCDKTFSLANQSNPNFGTRIIGGTNTERGQYPFLAAIFLLEGSKFICGGSLISNQHVLTGLLSLLHFLSILLTIMFGLSCSLRKKSP